MDCRLEQLIRRFGLNQAGIWQGNCFMEKHCSATFLVPTSTSTWLKSSYMAALTLMSCSYDIALSNNTLPTYPQAGFSPNL